MYAPAHFRIDDRDELFRIAARRSAGTLVVPSPEGLEASLLPWLVDAEPPGRLRGHCARANPIAEIAGTNPSALVLFDVADGYVSPSWYPSKAEHHRAVPTWNYVTVQVRGRLRRVDDARWLADHVRDLTDRHEREMAVPWSVSDAPPEWIDTLLRGIVGLEIEVERIEGKAKLGQNRGVADVEGILSGLEGRPNPDRLAAETRARALPAARGVSR